MVTGSRKPGKFAGLAPIVAICGGLLTSAQIRAEQEPACTCRDGRSVETGVVSYSRNSDRESVLRVEADVSRPHRPCRAIWIGRTEIHPTGTPYQFHLLRMNLQEKRLDGCNYAVDRYVRREKTYQFVFDSNSSSIREMRQTDPSDSGQFRGLGPGRQGHQSTLCRDRKGQGAKRKAHCAEENPQDQGRAVGSGGGRQCRPR